MSLTVVKFEPGEQVEVFDSLDQVGDLSPGTYVWADIQTKELAELSEVASFFGLHELSIEDCLTPGHFPKIDDYGAYLFMILRGMKPWPEVEELWETEALDPSPATEAEHVSYTRKVSIYLSQNFIVTHRRNEVAWLDAMLRQVQQYPEKILSQGTEGIAHRVIDVLIDRFMRGIGFFENIIEGFEGVAIEEPEDFEITDLFEIKRELTFLRQIARNQRAIVARLATDPTLIQDKQRRRYFKDIDDHAVDILRIIEKEIQDVMTIRDSYLAVSNIRLGDTMRILTVITTIAAPMNIVVGLYGMNFAVIPLLENPVGFWLVILAMLSLGALMLLFFRKKKWI